MTTFNNNNSIDTSLASNMATAQTNTEVTDVEKDTPHKSSAYVTRDMLMKQVEMLQQDNNKLIEILGKRNEDVVLRAKPVRGL